MIKTFDLTEWNFQLWKFFWARSFAMTIQRSIAIDDKKVFKNSQNF